MLEFKLLKKDNETRARLGRIKTAHGEIETPIFMPVGTNATVKGIWQDQLKEINSQIILGNAFHLYLRPGLDIIREFGGLHNFMNWDRPILTDSGGFQVFSIQNKKVLEEGVLLTSPLDGSKFVMTPELSMEIQMTLGSDIAMAFDECVRPGVEKKYIEKSIERTFRWAKKCKEVHKGPQALFGIVQGGFFNDLREKSAAQITSLDFEGYAVGGLSVGEALPITRSVLSHTMDFIPENKPRYLMGIGSPDLIISAVENGIDMFDCVLPTRIGRHGTALTASGKVNLKAAKFKYSKEPIDFECDCKVCQSYSRGYIHHLFKREEMLGKMMVSYHNIYFLLEFVRKIREAIAEDRFLDFKQSCFKRGLISEEIFIKN